MVIKHQKIKSKVKLGSGRGLRENGFSLKPRHFSLYIPHPPKIRPSVVLIAPPPPAPIFQMCKNRLGNPLDNFENRLGHNCKLCELNGKSFKP